LEDNESLDKMKKDIRARVAEALGPISSKKIEAPKPPTIPSMLNDVRLWVKSDLYGDKEIGDRDTTKNILEEIIDKLRRQGKVPKDFKFSRVVEPKEDMSGSGKFLTYLYTFKHKGEEIPFLIVNGLIVGKKVTLREFAPDKILSLDLRNKPYVEIDDVYEEVHEFIEKEAASPKTEYVSYLTRLAEDHSPEIDLGEITTRKEVSVGVAKDPTEELDAYDKDQILKDFGEILSGLVLGENDYLVGFPEDPAEKIIDLRAKAEGEKTDIGIGISVKLKKGAAPSVPGVYKRIKDLEKQDPGVLDGFKAIGIFEIINEYSASSGTIALASYLAGIPESNFSDNWNYFKKFVYKHADKEKFKKVDISAPPKTKNFGGNAKKEREVLSAIASVIDNFEEEYSDSQITEMVEEFRKKVGGKSKLEPYNRKRPGKKYGQLIYPLRTAVVDRLNNDKDLVESIRDMLTKLAVKQFHLYREKDKIDIKIVSYGATSFSFEPGGSGRDPGKQKIRFKLATE
jgi:hypothetical protein